MEDVLTRENDKKNRGQIFMHDVLPPQLLALVIVLLVPHAG